LSERAEGLAPIRNSLYDPHCEGLRCKLIDGVCQPRHYVGHRVRQHRGRSLALRCSPSHKDASRECRSQLPLSACDRKARTDPRLHNRIIASSAFSQHSTSPKGWATWPSTSMALVWAVQPLDAHARALWLEPLCVIVQRVLRLGRAVGRKRSPVDAFCAAHADCAQSRSSRIRVPFVVTGVRPCRSTRSLPVPGPYHGHDSWPEGTWVVKAELHLQDVSSRLLGCKISKSRLSVSKQCTPHARSCSACGRYQRCAERLSPPVEVSRVA
jgi:hypothetical protein